MSQRRWKRLVASLTHVKEPVLSAVRASAAQGGQYLAGYLVLTQSRLVFFFSGLPSARKTRDKGVVDISLTDVTGVEGYPVAGDATTKLSVFADGQEYVFLLRCSQPEADTFAAGLATLRQGKDSSSIMPLTKPQKFSANVTTWWNAIMVSSVICSLSAACWLILAS